MPDLVRRFGSRRRLAAVVLALTAALALALWWVQRVTVADAGDASQGGPSASSPAGHGGRSSGPSASTFDDAPSATAKAAPRRRLGPRVIAWVIDLAPLSGGASGLEDEAFDSLVDGSCTGPSSAPLDALSEPSRTLYDAANDACQAAFHDRPGLWPGAAAKLTKAEAVVDQLDCRQVAVLTASRALVDAHAQYPDAALIRGRGGESYGTCPLITELVPDHGDTAGGYSVQVVGKHLPALARIHLVTRVDSRAYETVQTVRTDGRRATITMVASPRPGQVDDYVGIWVEGWPFTEIGNPWFTFDEPGRTATTTNTTPPTGPTTPRDTGPEPSNPAGGASESTAPEPSTPAGGASESTAP